MSDAIKIGTIPKDLSVQRLGPLSLVILGPGGFVEVELPNPGAGIGPDYGVMCTSIIEQAVRDVQAMPPTTISLGEIDETAISESDEKATTIEVNCTASATPSFFVLPSDKV